jgi:DNA-binding CsgD family transcriptional regulator
MAQKYNVDENDLHIANNLVKKAKTATELKMALSVTLGINCNLTSKEISNVLNIEERTVYSYRTAIHKSVITDETECTNSWGGRRNCNLSLEEEFEFLNKWKSKAIDGLILNIKEVHSDFETTIGHTCPLSTTYRLMARHGWRKIKLDTRHPKSDTVLQEEFKKTPNFCGYRQQKNQ